MITSCLSLLQDPKSLKLALPIEFVKLVGGDYWNRTKITINHESGISCTAWLRSVRGESVVTDGWISIVKGLKLTKNTLLVLRIIKEKCLQIHCFIENVCDESFLTVNRYGDLKIIVIPEAYVNKFYCYWPVKDSYNIYAAGQCWKVETEKINACYVFAKGCPEMFEYIDIEDGDILMLMKTDSESFDLTLYRSGVEVVFRKKETTKDNSVVEIPKHTYYEHFNSIFTDQEDSIDQLITGMNDEKHEVNKKSVEKEKLKSERKSFVSEGNNNQTKEDVKKKGKQIASDSTSEEPKQLICCTTYDHSTVSATGRQTRDRLVNKNGKRSRMALKVSNEDEKRVAHQNYDQESGAYQFNRKANYRMRLPVEVVNRARLTKKVHQMNVRNMDGKTVVKIVKRQKDGNGFRYAIEGWPSFIKENDISEGDNMHLTYVKSGNLLMLTHVDAVSQA